MSARNSPPSHAIDISEEAGVRYLHFGSSWVQGAMRIARPWSLELSYTREMMAGLLMRPSARWPRKVLLIGLGAGSLAKFLYRYFPDCRISVVEINPQVEFIARQYFKLPDDPLRLAIRIGCGADYVQTAQGHFDLILTDGFDADGHSGPLESESFFQNCRARLTPDGLLGVNLLREKGFQQRVDRIHRAFEGQGVVFPSCDSGNTIVFARGDTPVGAALESMRTRADEIRKSCRLDLRPTITRLQLALPLPDGCLRF